MAEAAILGALKLLGEALASDLMRQVASQVSESFSGIPNLEVQMKNLFSELKVMQAFHDQIDAHNQRNKTLVAWLEQEQNVANEIECIMEKFIYLNNKQKYGRNEFYLKRFFKQQKLSADLKQLATQLKVAEERIRHLGEMKDRWSITIDGSTTSINDANESAVQVAFSSQYIDEKEIVGIDLERKKLTSLINSKDPSCIKISVWGMAGIGKTTLVANVFKREKKHFSHHAWICISQIYKVDQVLRNLISNICKNDNNNVVNTNNTDIRELKEKVRSLLQCQKFLIVLDDVWDPNFIRDLIRDVFVEFNKGSRIIITSRIADVASLAKESNRLELKPLPEKESWSLFCRKAFKCERKFKCPPHLDEWAKLIVCKCGGLPLVLVSIGCVLSDCGNNEDEWRRINDQLFWGMENNYNFDRLRNILKLSFDYLPICLKNCFLYCCMFPENYLLPRKKLIRLWIAEGFVEQKKECTLEAMAEGYLLQLINHSMLLIARKSISGRVQRCQMHGILRDLAISLCRKEKFGLLYGVSKEVNIDYKYVRRLSIIKFGNTIDHHVQLPQLETFMSFDLSMHPSQFITTCLLKCRGLTVLNLDDLSIESVPENIGDLFNLRYLGMRNTKVKLLPNSIKKLHNLQTLDLYNCEVKELPGAIVELTQLRHLIAEFVIDSTHNSLRCCGGIKLSKNMFYLKEMQTIHAVESSDMVVRKLRNLIQLRSFRIYGVKENQCIELCISLSKMSFLSSLTINANNENEILHFEGLNLPRIEKLQLRGKLGESSLNSLLFQTSVESMQQLWLDWSQLQNDPLPSLFQLRNLTMLGLDNAYEGEQLIFQTGWFPKLKHLLLYRMANLVNVEMKRDSMVSLERIDLKGLKITNILGLKNLISLKWMGWSDMPANFGWFGGWLPLGDISYISGRFFEHPTS